MDPSSIMADPFIDHKETYAGHCPPLSVGGGSFNSSFSSDLSSSFSSPMQELDNPYDEWSATASLRSITPPDPVYSMSVMTHSMLGLHEDSSPFSTPIKSSMAHNMMDYDFPNYGSFDSQDFMATPGLALDLGSSPMMEIHTPSPHRRQFIEPSQTFLQCQPSTPASSMMSMANNSVSPTWPPSGIPYFISPIQAKQEPQSPSPLSKLSSRSITYSTPTRAIQKSHMLHRVTDNAKVRKSSNKQCGGVGFIPEGKFRCPWVGCKSDHAFKRQEHLKRHYKTHSARKDLVCTYCKKPFQVDRFDNYKSHVKLHAKPQSKGSRTEYFPAAELEVASWQKDPSRSSRVKLEPAAPIRRLSERTSSHV